MGHPRILLLDAEARWIGAPTAHVRQVVPPVGLMYLSSYLKRHCARPVETRIVSTLLQCTEQSALADLLRDFAPHIVGIRGLSTFAAFFHECCATVKSTLPRVPVIAGGPYASAEVQRVLSDPNVDIAVIGEGEETMAELVSRHLTAGTWHDVPGTATSCGGEVRMASSRPYPRNLDQLPFPDYDAIPVDAYARVLSYCYNRRRQAVIVSSRGCPYACSFCHRTMGQEFRARSPENVLDELRWLYGEHEMRDFYFVDDNFALDRQRATSILQRIAADLPQARLYFANGLRADILDRGLIDLMVEAGAIWITYAIESASPRIQSLIGKNLDLGRTRDTIEYTAGKGIMVNYCGIVGFPTETVEEVWQTIRFMESLPPFAVPMLFYPRYFPNTELRAQAIAEGLDPETMEREMRTPFHTPGASGTPTLPAAELQKALTYFMRHVFLQKERINVALKAMLRFYSEEEALDAYRLILDANLRSLQDIPGISGELAQ